MTAKARDGVDAADHGPVSWPPMSEWMRAWARRAEAEIAAGTYPPGPPDDPARLAARLAALKAQQAELHAQQAEREAVPARTEEHDVERPSATHGQEHLTASELVMPEDMRQQAVRTEAALAAGTLPPDRPDDLTELAERITLLRERVAAHAEQTGTPSDAADNDRREQLNRWHQHDSTTQQDGCAAEADNDSGDSDGSGWSQ